MKYLFSFLLFSLFVLQVDAQENNQIDLAAQLKEITNKGDYAIVEVRLNKEDEFRTMEGGNSSLARIAIYTGTNQGQELLVKGFEGMNSVVAILNQLKQNSWKLIDVYTIKGESLILTHYVIERKK